MSYEINPKDFNPLFNVVGCIIESEGQIVLLQRKNSSIQGNKWGIPSGKVEDKEDLLSAIQREIEEETQIKISKDQIKKIKIYRVRHIPGYDFIYYLFYTKIPERHKIKLDKNEHLKAVWINPKDVLKLPLVEGTEKYIKKFYKLR